MAGPSKSRRIDLPTTTPNMFINLSITHYCQKGSPAGMYRLVVTPMKITRREGVVSREFDYIADPEMRTWLGNCGSRFNAKQLDTAVALAHEHPSAIAALTFALNKAKLTLADEGESKRWVAALSKGAETPAFPAPAPVPADAPDSVTARTFAEAAAEVVARLYGRWRDESEFEDIADYSKPIEPIAARHGVKIVQMNKSPFGFDFAVDGRTYRLSATLKAVQYKRIA